MPGLNAMDWLYNDLANHAGIKGTFKEKISWAHTATKSYQAKDALRYRACWQAIQDSLAGKPIGYLVGLDASASGAQMIGCLMRCAKTLGQTGLINEKPKDLYSTTQKALNQAGIECTRNEVKYVQMP